MIQKSGQPCEIINTLNGQQHSVKEKEMAVALKGFTVAHLKGVPKGDWKTNTFAEVPKGLC